ncbi:MAG: polysaccharide biosynthesis protein, partial [Thermotogota bacterium]
FSLMSGKSFAVGEAGILLLEDLKKSKSDKNVIAFIDDSKRKIGRKVRGIDVLGPIADLDIIIAEKKIDEIIVAIPSADSNLMKRITSKVDLKRVEMKVLPSITEIIENKIAADQIREVAIEDLLGREPVRLDLSEIEDANKDKIILVTGAGGSIGSEITRQLIAMKPRRIIALGRGENSIYCSTNKFSPLLKEFNTEFVSVIGDVTDQQRLVSIFKEFTPEVVYHCAAHKHVPLMEENPSEAFRVNSLGTKTLVDVCLQNNVQRFTLISTDKAVNPTSIMGLSKRLAEMYIRSLAKTEVKTKFSVVRFGNVLGSRGSVIPKFKEQIKNGGPVTITDKNMRRFFMTIPEASSLVLQASSFMKNGDLFILDMGEQIYIKDLVENMIILAGLVPGQDIEIEYTGIRPGEKLYEELFLDMEKALTTKHPKIYRVIEDEKYACDEVARLMERLYHLSVEKQMTHLKKLIDQYIPDNQIEFEGGKSDANKLERVFETKKS